MNNKSPCVGLVVLQDDERGGVRYIQAYARSEKVTKEPGMEYWLPFEVATGDDSTIEDKGTAYLEAFIKALQEKPRIPSDRWTQRHPEIDDRSKELVTAHGTPSHRQFGGEGDDLSHPAEPSNIVQEVLQGLRGFVGWPSNRRTTPEFHSPERQSSERKLLKRKLSQKKRKDIVTISFSWECDSIPLNGAFCNINLEENGDLLTISANLPMLELENNPQDWYIPIYSREAVLEAVKKIANHQEVDLGWVGENPPERSWYFNTEKKKWQLAYLVEGVSDLSEESRQAGRHSMITLPQIMDFVIDANSKELVIASRRSRVF